MYTVSKLIKDNKKILITSIIIQITILLVLNFKIEGYNFKFLPKIYASINGLTSILLITSLIFIKNKKVLVHEIINKICIFLSVIFLFMYIIYHVTTQNTEYGGESFAKTIYLLILITHILLSIIVIPLVLLAFVTAKKNVENHKKIVMYAYPIWLYITITGVIVYLMISPYYK